MSTIALKNSKPVVARTNPLRTITKKTAPAGKDPYRFGQILK